jgi:hypothetical protein
MAVVAAVKTVIVATLVTFVCLGVANRVAGSSDGLGVGGARLSGTSSGSAPAMDAKTKAGDVMVMMMTMNVAHNHHNLRLPAPIAAVAFLGGACNALLRSCCAPLRLLSLSPLRLSSVLKSRMAF